MDSFYLTILSIATIVLILALTYVGVLLYGTTSTKVFPSTQNACPDYWAITDDGKCVFPPEGDSKNRGNIAVDSNNKWKVTDNRITGTNIISYGTGNVSPTYFDMNATTWDNIYGKKSALCNKKYWANSNQISWDGVSNTNQC